MSAICKTHSELAWGQSLFPIPPAFDFFVPSFHECVVQRIWNGRVFENLFGERFQYKGSVRFRLEFDCSGWRFGYSDDDVARTPRMVRAH